MASITQLTRSNDSSINDTNWCLKFGPSMPRAAHSSWGTTKNVGTSFPFKDATLTKGVIDSAIVVVTDTSSNTSTISRSDTATVGITDTSTNLITSTRTDTPTVVVTDTSTNLKISARTDTPTIVITDVSTNTVSSTRTETPTVVVTDTSSLLKTSTRTDTPTITISESVTVINTLSRTDTPIIVISDVSSNVVTSSRSDNPTIGTTNTSSNLITSSRSDTPTAVITAIAAVVVIVAVSDTITTGISEYDSQLKTFQIVEGETGWSTRTKPASASGLYVSSSVGSDSNNGSINSPIATLSEMYNRITAGNQVWALLKRGDVWNEAPPQWNKSGGSTAFLRSRVGAYGSGLRPLIYTNNAAGFSAHSAQGQTGNWEFVDLHINGQHASGDGCDGIAFRGTITNIHIENCVVERFTTGIVGEDDNETMKNFTVHRSIVQDNYHIGDSTHPQGMFLSGIDGISLTENVIDYNGWNAASGAIPTIFRHNIYIQTNCKRVTAKRNIISRSASEGIQMRTGGVAVGNLLMKNSTNLMWHPHTPAVLGYHRCGFNTILDSRDIDVDNPRGGGIEIDAASGHQVYENVIAWRTDAATYNLFGIYTKGSGYPELHHNIIYHWEPTSGGGPIGLAVEDRPIRSHHNDIQMISNEGFCAGLLYPGADYIGNDNRYSNPNIGNNKQFSYQGAAKTLAEWQALVTDTNSSLTTVNYTDPRDIDDYMDYLGYTGEGLTGFVTRARLSDVGNWDKRFTAGQASNYVREGFDKSDILSDQINTLTATIVSNNVTLDWTAPSVSSTQNYGIEKYVVYRRAYGGTNNDWNILTITSSNTYADNSITEQWEYCVTALDVEGYETPISNIVDSLVDKSVVDSVVVVISNTSSNSITLSRTDNPTIIITESRLNTITSSRTDTPTVVITDTSTNLLALSRSETITVGISETSSVDTNGGIPVKSGTDSPTISISESVAIVVTSNRTDDLVLSVNDVNTILSSLNAIDSLIVQLGNTSTVINAIQSVDSLILDITDNTSNTSTLNRTDNLLVSISDIKNLVIPCSLSDIVNISIEELSNVQDVTFIATNPHIIWLDGLQTGNRGLVGVLPIRRLSGNMNNINLIGLSRIINLAGVKRDD